MKLDLSARFDHVGHFWAFLANFVDPLASETFSKNMLGTYKVKIYKNHSKQAKPRRIEEIGV